MRTWRIEAHKRVRQPAMHRPGNTGSARHSIGYLGWQSVDRDVFAAPRKNRAGPARAQRPIPATLAFEKILEVPMAPPAAGLRYRRTGGKRAGVLVRPVSQLQEDSPESPKGRSFEGGSEQSGTGTKARQSPRPKSSEWRRGSSRSTREGSQYLTGCCWEPPAERGSFLHVRLTRGSDLNRAANAPCQSGRKYKDPMPGISTPAGQLRPTLREFVSDS